MYERICAAINQRLDNHLGGERAVCDRALGRIEVQVAVPYDEPHNNYMVVLWRGRIEGGLQVEQPARLYRLTWSMVRGAYRRAIENYNGGGAA